MPPSAPILVPPHNEVEEPHHNPTHLLNNVPGILISFPGHERSGIMSEKTPLLVSPGQSPALVEDPPGPIPD
eukprot:IDg6174t1